MDFKGLMVLSASTKHLWGVPDDHWVVCLAAHKLIKKEIIRMDVKIDKRMKKINIIKKN